MNISVVTETTESFRGYVFYDAGCAFCTGWAARASDPLLRRGYHFVPLQSPCARKTLHLKNNELPTEMKVMKDDGKVMGGADALVEIARSIWWAWPAVALAALPGGLWLMRTAYRWVAENRHKLGKACALPHARRDHETAITSGFYDMP